MRTPTYYARGLLRQLLPYTVANRRRTKLLEQSADCLNSQEIDQRVAYYNKVSRSFDASEAPRIAEISRRKSRYYIDLDEFSRGFGPDRRLDYLFGDVITTPLTPTIVKSRPIGPDNENAILLNLDKLRHFSWSRDPVPFRKKKDAAVWRGTPLNAQRKALVRTFYNHPSFDIGHIRGEVDDLPPKSALSHAAQKRYKFFISLEGYDVATNLKWGMASNMLVMSPKLQFETWFMEGRLEPGKHFVLLKEDLSDLEEKVDYFIRHTEEAEDIIRNANAWVAQFCDPLKERIVASRVLEQYFRLSGQI